ncbi:MAG: DUF2948 family protein [Reyranellaceae bacterium]
MTPLKLRAEDAEDLQVISSALQDSLVAVRDIGFLPDQKRFALVVNRFCWEAPPDAEGHYWRTHCALAFDTVAGVASHDIDRRFDDRLLSLLAIEVEAAAPGGGSVILLRFAGKSAIRLEVQRILCHLEDVGEAWPTGWRPGHRLE